MDSVGKDIQYFGEGVLEGINHAGNTLIEDVSGHKMPDLKFSNQEDLDRSVFGQSGNIVGGISNPMSTVDKLGNGVVEVGQQVWNTGKLAAQDVSNVATDLVKDPSKLGDDMRGIRHQVANEGYGALDGALDMVNGTTQFVNHVAGTDISKISTSDAANFGASTLGLPHVEIDENEIRNSVTGQWGDTEFNAGVAVAVAAATDGVGDALGLGVLGQVGLDTAVGAPMAMVTQETSDGEDFWKQRLANATDGAVSSAKGSATSSAFESFRTPLGEVAGKLTDPGSDILIENGEKRREKKNGPA